MSTTPERSHPSRPTPTRSRQTDLYDRVAHETSAIVIHRYSTSFGLASRLLGRRVRGHVENVYALVRVADEIVDGVAASAALPAGEVLRELDAFEAETERALASGYSTNLVVHAFALTARECGFGVELTRPFFASMRADVSETEHDPESFDAYVYGSAEVVGLMCLRAFLLDAPARTPEQDERFVLGARRLGAAFQKVNFLRDLSADVDGLGRSYFPGVDVATFDEAEKVRLLDDIDLDLIVSGEILRELPSSSRRAVLLAHDLFAELSAQLRATPAAELLRARVSVPNTRKAVIAARAAVSRGERVQDVGRRGTPPLLSPPGAPESRGGRSVRSALVRHRVLRGEKTREIVIIGGGISGLASAALLARDGHRVTVLERQAAVGGRAGSWEHDGFRFDTGPSWYLMPEVFDHFFRLCGTTAAERLDLVKLDPGYRVYSEPAVPGEAAAAPIDIQASREANLALFESIEPGAADRMRAYLASARDTYEVAKRRFLYTSFESFLPLLRGDVLSRTPTLVKLLTEPLDDFAGRFVTDPRLRQILGYPAVFLGSSPFEAPSMYHLMSHLDLEDGVYYPKGGFTELIAAVRDVAVEAGVTIETDARVRRILTTRAPRGSAKAAEVVGVEYERGGETHTRSADVVVTAADLHHAETTMLEPELQSYGEEYWADKTPGPSALLLLLGVRGELPQLEHHTLLFTRDWRDNFGRIFGAETSVPDPASLYVCRPSASDDSVAPEGHENLFVLVPIPADPSIGAGGVDGAGDARVEALSDAVIEQIATWTGVADLAERVVVRRTIGPADFENDLGAWRGTALGPAHTLKQSAFFRAGNVSTKVDGLYYVGGSTIPGIGLPMCLISAEILLKRLRGDTSTEPLPEPGV